MKRLHSEQLQLSITEPTKSPNDIFSEGLDPVVDARVRSLESAGWPLAAAIDQAEMELNRPLRPSQEVSGKPFDPYAPRTDEEAAAGLAGVRVMHDILYNNRPE